MILKILAILGLLRCTGKSPKVKASDLNINKRDSFNIKSDINESNIGRQGSTAEFELSTDQEQHINSKDESQNKEATLHDIWPYPMSHIDKYGQNVLLSIISKYKFYLDYPMFLKINNTPVDYVKLLKDALDGGADPNFNNEPKSSYFYSYTNSPIGQVINLALKKESSIDIIYEMVKLLDNYGADELVLSLETFISVSIGFHGEKDREYQPQVTEKLFTLLAKILKNKSDFKTTTFYKVKLNEFSLDIKNYIIQNKDNEPYKFLCNEFELDDNS